MKTQAFTGTPTSRRQAVLPSAITSPGTPLLIGRIPCVSLDSYQSNVAGATVLLNGTFNMAVVGESAASPVVTSQVNPGDPLYASGGTLDATTNVRYGFTLDKNISGIFYGWLDIESAAVPAGTTVTTGVYING